MSIDADVYLFFAALARNGNSSIGRVLNKALRKRALQIQASIRGVAVENTFQQKLDSKNQ